MDFKRDFLEFVKKDLIKEGVIIPSNWTGKKLCINFLELTHRWFDYSKAYEVEYSKELLAKLPTLNQGDNR